MAERRNRHLLEVARSLLFQMNVPKSYWSEAVLAATYIVNSMPTRVLNSRSPIDHPSSIFPHFQGIRNFLPKIFGFVAFVHVHNHSRSKLDPRAIKCLFLGYSSTQKG